ncbi:hypothetical protein ICY20_08790 [Pseudomonas sp. P115]|uniref:hypothetical protein n=1 Tax=Pseudomonas pisciculturae TaxID=2730413 RepID=UPI00135BD4F5|nr:hypothetical protein [Pseudomonas pisciculturae]MBF6027832.1 hypothetical protein [Pseudomonas pisciculturae]
MMTISTASPSFAVPNTASLPPSTSAPPAHETSFATQARQHAQSLNNLSKHLNNSPHQEGYLRFSPEKGWKFSPNMSLRDKLHLRDAGFSKAAINPADMKLVKPGEKIALSTLANRLEKQMVSASNLLNTLEPAATTPPIAKPRKSAPAANVQKPATTPRTVFPSALSPDLPIPAPRSDLPKFRNVNEGAEQRLSSASNEQATPSVMSRAHAWENQILTGR